jgi:CIC family chloride channel protein
VSPRVIITSCITNDNGILSGLFHAPLTAIFLIAEITGGYDLMIVASVSFAVSKRFEKHSLDVKNLPRKGNAFTSNKDANILCSLEIEDLIKKDYLTVEPGQPLADVAGLLAHSDQVIFAALDNGNELRGLVYFNGIREVIFDNLKTENILVRDIMTQPVQPVHLFDSMETVMKKFEKSGKVFLPVLKNGKYYGFITKSDVLESYRNRLK